MAENYLRLTSLEDGNSISIVKVRTPNTCTFEYRTNSNNAWQTYTISTNISLQTNDWVEFRKSDGIALAKTLSDNAYNFKMSKKTAARGDLRTLINYQDIDADLPQYAFAMLFDSCTTLVQAPDLMAPKLSIGCYANLFWGCSSLKEAPIVNFEDIASSQNMAAMFSESGIEKFEFPFLTNYKSVNAVQQMFYKCTMLKEIIWKNNEIPSSSTFGSSWLGNVSPTGTFYYTDPNLNVAAISRTASGIPAGWEIKYLAPKPPLVFSINSRVVSSLTINGKAVSKLNN